MLLDSVGQQIRIPLSGKEMGAWLVLPPSETTELTTRS